MPPRYGTLSVMDTLAAYNEASVLDVGEDEINGYIRLILDAYNSQVIDMLGDLVGPVPDRETSYGIDASTGEMVDLDEYGLADAQKFPFLPATVGFPLRRKGATLQWTKDHLSRTTPAELGRQVLGIVEADKRSFYGAIRRVLFGSSNNLDYVDRLRDNRTIAIRALANGDGQSIPPTPITGAAFDPATHSHYLATTTLTEAAVLSAISTVTEHWDRGQGRVRMYINEAQEAAYRAFAGFTPYVDPRIVYRDDQNRAAQTVDLLNTADRTIGFIGLAEVSVKPWVPATYHLAFIDDAGSDPVIGLRRPDGRLAPTGELRLVANLDRHPLHAQAYERYYGMAAWNRVRAASLFSGGATYVNLA